MRIAIIFLLMLCTGVSFAQSSKKRKKKEENLEERQPTSLEPNYAEMEDYEPKKSKKGSSGPELRYESQEQYHDRMEALVKEKKKIARIMEAPQYSDPMYFGHKHLPKKHKPGKMKYCKVCGIRH